MSGHPVQSISFDRVWFILFIFLAAALMAAGTAVVSVRQEATLNEAESGLLHQAAAIAEAVDPEKTKMLSFSGNDETSPAFLRMNRQLSEYSDAGGFRKILLIVAERKMPVYGPYAEAGRKSARPAPGTQAKDTLTMENRTMKILILDDDPFMIQLMATMLERLGYDRIKTAERGADALECISREDSAPDLVLCDLIMPEMDGLEFARNLVTQRFNGTLIIVSGADHRILESTEKLLQAHSIRVLGRLHKPYNKDELKAILDRWSPPPEPAGTSRRKVYSPEEIGRAIENREMISYYQPKVEVATGRVIGMESLARWRHPEDGLVFPDQFIGVAEESGRIDDLTRLVLTNSLSAVRAWHDAGLGIGAAVNISMDNLKTLDFPDFIDKKLDETGVSPDQVTLEITESRLMENHLLSIEVLTRIFCREYRMC